MIESRKKTRKPASTRQRGPLPGEDLFAVFALWVVVLIAIGIAFHGVNATVGGAIIAALPQRQALRSY